MRLAFGEIRRAKLRFALLMIAVGLLVFLIVFQQSLAGSLLGEFTGGLEHQSAAVLGYGEDARRSVDGSRVTPEQISAVERVPGVGDAGPIGEASFTVRLSGGSLSDASVFGYELGGPGAPTTLSSGRLPEGDREAVASAGAGAGFGVGETVAVVPGDVPLRIVGLADDIAFNVQPSLFVSYPTYEELVRTTNPDATVVLPSLVGVEPAGGVDPVALASRITAVVEGIEALDRQTAVDSLPGVSSIRQSFAIILGLAFVVVALLTGFFFLIITVQKTTSLTLLRAVGASTGYLLGNLVVQVVVVVGIGLLIAMALLGLAAAALSSQQVGVRVEPSTLGLTVVAVVALGLLAAVGAMRRVARLDPAAATARTAGGGLA
jgi:putative ABC transport system permease protein